MSDFFGKNANFLKKLAALGIPIALQSLLSLSGSLINTFMVGRLGDIALSGVYMGNQIKILLTVFLVGVEGALVALSAQYHGMGEHEKIKSILGLCLIFAISLAVLLTLICFFFSNFMVSLFTNKKEIIDTGAAYLRILSLSFVPFSLTQLLIAAFKSVESAKIGFASSAIALAFNAMFGYVFVFGKFGAPRLESVGAAAATLIGHGAELLFVIFYTVLIDKKLMLRIKSLGELFHFNKSIVRELIKYGSPIISAQILWGGNILFASAVMGRQGKTAVTAMSIAGTLLNLSHIVTNGCAGALGITIGKAIGEGNDDDAKRFAKASQIIFPVIGVLTSLFILLLKVPFISIYDISAEAEHEASLFINVLAAVTAGTCYQSAMLNGVLKSAKDTAFVFWVEFISVTLFVFPAAIIASRLNLTPWIIFALLKCDQFIKCIPAAIRVNRFRWAKKSNRLNTF